MPDINKVELLQKQLEMRIKILERTVENLKNADRADDTKAKFSVLEKQVGVLMASTLTKADLKVLEDSRSARDAAERAKFNREISETQKAIDAQKTAYEKESKALVRNAEISVLNQKISSRFDAMETRFAQLEARLQILEGLRKKK